MDIYADMRAALESELKDYSGQGAIQYIQPGAQYGPDYDPSYGPDIPHDVIGKVKGVAQKYLANELIRVTDKQCLVLPTTREGFNWFHYFYLPYNSPEGDVNFTTSGTLSIDGRVHQIIQVDPLPAAGDPVAWRIFVRA